MDGIHPKLKPYVKTLVAHEIGLQREQPQIGSIECGHIVKKHEIKWGDRFQLRISYCKKILTWQVLMCPDNLMAPPDFIMEDNFLADAGVDLIRSEVPSLAHWQPSDPKCLLNVVLELLQLYKHFQGNLLQDNPRSRYFLEYDTLLNIMQIPYEDLEVFVHHAGRVCFLINLTIDFSLLQIPLYDKKNLVLLYIDLRDNYKNNISVIKRKELDGIFGEIDLPELRSDLLLIDYIPLIGKYLQSKVDDIVHKLNQRKSLYTFLLQNFEPAILNGDNITFENISFLLEINGIYCVVQVVIPLTFPDDCPVLSLSSMTQQKTDKPITIRLSKYDYDSGWEIEKTFEIINDIISNLAFS